MPDLQWQPSVTIEQLRRRQQLMSGIRSFFADRGVLEVDTPLLSRVTATDPHLDSFDLHAGSDRRYLLTSPEHAMKRLLAAGSGPIFQLSRAFRKGEVGRRHNPEFTMLEWYRPGFSLAQLQAEVCELLRFLGYRGAVQEIRYRKLFEQCCGLDPIRDSTQALVTKAVSVSGLEADQLHRDDALDLLMTHLVEPAMSSMGAVVVSDFPASQAALARVADDVDGDPVARRFELYIDGLEIANAYDELVDAKEQRIRFDADNRLREKLGKPTVPVDMRLLAALPDMPESAGIALGVDRLLMVLSGATSIQEVIPFPEERI